MESNNPMARHERKIQLRQYQLHREAVRRAKSLVDVKPSQISLHKFLNKYTIRNDRKALIDLTSKNLLMLLQMTKASLAGTIDNSFKTEFIHQSQLSKSNDILELVDKDNFRIGCSILKSKSEIDTGRRHKLLNDEMKNRQRHSIIPLHKLNQYSNIIPMADNKLLLKLLRPRIYLELYIKGLRSLGHLSIQLFTEACPEVVLEFVRMCTHNKAEQFKFIRIFPVLWAEAEISVQPHRLNTPGYSYDMNALDHGIGPGVFSFAKSYLNGFPQGLLNFSVSFKPLPVLNGERVPFALVTRGLRTLDCLRDYGTKNGKMHRNISVSACGLL